MKDVIGNLGKEMDIEVVRGSDYTFTLVVTDITETPLDVSVLLVWVSATLAGNVTVIDWDRTATGTFQIVIPRAATDLLPAFTDYTIGYVDAAGGYQPSYYGILRVPQTSRMGT